MSHAAVITERGSTGRTIHHPESRDDRAKGGIGPQPYCSLPYGLRSLVIISAYRARRSAELFVGLRSATRRIDSVRPNCVRRVTCGSATVHKYPCTWLSAACDRSCTSSSDEDEEKHLEEQRRERFAQHTIAGLYSFRPIFRASPSVTIMTMSNNTIITVPQIAIRCLTFVINAFVLRHVSQNEIGVTNVRLLLLESTILFLSREAFRRACLTNTLNHNWPKVINIIWLSYGINFSCLPHYN